MASSSSSANTAAAAAAAAAGDRLIAKIVGTLVLSAIAVVVILYTVDFPRYYVAIDSVSGLDTATATPDYLRLNRTEFILAVRVASESLVRRECLGTGTYLEVVYRGHTLAASETLKRPLCAGPRKSEEERRVVATGTGVLLPGDVLDSLVADVRQGVQLFDVMLKVYVVGHGISVHDCGVRSVGNAVSACPTAWL